MRAPMVWTRWQHRWSGAALLVLFAGTVAFAGSEQRLVEAAKARDLTAVRWLLDEKVDVDGAQPDGATALHWAAYWNDLDMVEVLLDAGAQASAVNELGATPLWLASFNCNPALVERLLTAGADPNRALLEGETPLLRATRTGCVEPVDLLLRHGADVNAAERVRAQTALMWAAAGQHDEVVRVLLSHEANVRARSKTFHRLVNTAITSFVGADARAVSAGPAPPVMEQALGGFTPLLFAAKSGNAEAARLLLDAGAPVDEPAPNGATPLVIAARGGHTELAVYLLERGADPDAYAAGHTALHVAVLRGDLALAKALASRGANLNLPVTQGTPKRRQSADWAILHEWIGGTPLWLAARFVDIDMLDLLVSAGSHAPVTAANGQTSLMAAVNRRLFAGHDRRGRVIRNGKEALDPAEQPRIVEVVQVLIGLGESVNDVDPAGNTVLHFAAAEGLDDVVRFLADHGAMLNVRNQRGQTPLQVAQGGARKTTAELLQMLGAQ